MVAVLANLDAVNLKEKHGSAEHVASVERLEANAVDGPLLVEVDRLDAVHAALNVLLVVEHVLDRDVADLDKVGQQPAVNGLGGVRHEHAALERRLFQKPR